MKKKIAPYLLFVFLVGFLVFLYGFSSNRNKNKKIEKITVEFEGGKTHFLTHEMVKKMLIQNNKYIKNQPKNLIDLYRLKKTVLSNPFVEKATVFLTLNGVLNIRVKQREPLMRVVGDDEVYYIDKYGVKFPTSTNFSSRVPLVSGVEDLKSFRELIQLVSFILKDNFLKKEIISIQKNKLNEFIFDVRSGNYTIDFGKLSNIDKKFKKLKAFYNKSLSDKTIKKYKVINVKYHNQVVCIKQQQDEKQ